MHQQKNAVLNGNKNALLNKVNKEIHDRIYKDGEFHLHQFSLDDDLGVIKKDEILYPLRYMSGNPNITNKTLKEMVTYVEKVGKEVLNEWSL